MGVRTRMGVKCLIFEKEANWNGKKMNGGSLLRISHRIPRRCFHISSAALFPKRWKEKSEPPFQSELKNPVAEVYGGAEAWPEDQFGTLYDKKPSKVSVKKYHLYKWCGCGRSHSQPFCDTTCKNIYWKKNIIGGPITYIAPEDKDIWFCLCKRTQHRPFCDGSHRDEEIQAMKVEGKIEMFEPFK